MISLEDIVHRPTNTIRLGGVEFLQAENALADLGAVLESQGKKAVLYSDEPVANVLQESHHLFAEILTASGKCTWEEVRRAESLVSRDNVLVGAGGGRVLDTAKLVAHQLGMTYLLVPTSCATCSAASNHSVVYEGENRIESIRITAPAVVLIDYEVIARSPRRLLRAGLLDSLSKYFEGRLCAAQAEGRRYVHSLALALAKDLAGFVIANGRALLTKGASHVIPLLW